MEVTEALPNTLELESEWNGSEIVLTETMVGLVLLGVHGKSSSLILVDDHWALDQVVVNSQWSHFLSIKDTENGHILGETFTSYLNKLISSVIWGTLRERTIESVVVVLEFIISEVHSVEGQINPDVVTTAEAGWRSALHRVLINEVSGHEADWGVEVIITLEVGIIIVVTWLFGVHQGESAHNCLESISSIGEFLTLEPDLGTTSNVTVSWSDIVQDWLLIVAELVVRVHPVDSIERNHNLNSIGLCGGWRIALNSRGRNESSSNDNSSEVAEWELTVHWVLGEPGS